MKKTELEKYKKILLEKLAIIKQDVADIGKSTLEGSKSDSSGNLTHIPTHMADMSADTFNQELNLGLMETEAAVIKEIEQALERVEDKTYGKCNECGKIIGKKRLEHIPYAKLCIECKTEFEQR